MAALRMHISQSTVSVQVNYDYDYAADDDDDDELRQLVPDMVSLERRAAPSWCRSSSTTTSRTRARGMPRH